MPLDDAPADEAKEDVPEDAPDDDSWNLTSIFCAPLMPLSNDDPETNGAS